jgi:hypothetical protein
MGDKFVALVGSGRQVCYILQNKFVALVGSGQQTCRPSHDEKGLKDWAIDSHGKKIDFSRNYVVLLENVC